MKTYTILVLGILAFLAANAQEQSPLPLISQKLSDYSSNFSKEKVFVVTDKQIYRPGETIWFRAFVTDPDNRLSEEENRELYVKLYDKEGTQLLQEMFRLKAGSAQGDILLPEKLKKNWYFLVAYCSPAIASDEIWQSRILVDPEYSNQLLAETNLKDSVTVTGTPNELSVTLSDKTGEIQKNTRIQYQIKHASEILEKGKLKTDDAGRASFTFTIPEQKTEEPYWCELFDAGENLIHKIFLPTTNDRLIVNFYPEGGNLILGTAGKVGFTACNAWGMPVELEGILVDQNGKTVSIVKTFVKGLGMFSVQHQNEQKLRLEVSGKAGKNQSFDIPAPSQNGLSLAIVKTDAEFISANMIFADKQKHIVALTVTKGGTLFWAADMAIEGMSRVKIPTENLPHGISQLSVFDPKGQVLGERLIFVDKNQKLNIGIETEKNTIHPNQSLNVKVRLTDENNQPVAGNIAISIADIQRTEKYNLPLDKYLQAQADFVTPFSLIAKPLENQISNSFLFDIFLIANRLKGFDWNDILHANQGTLQAAGAMNKVLSGTVSDRTGMKINKAKVSLVNNSNMQLYTTTTNAQGEFSLANLISDNPDDYSIKATDQEGKRELSIELNKNFESRISDYIRKTAIKQLIDYTEQPIDKEYLRNNSFLFQKAEKTTRPPNTAAENQRRMLETSTNLLDVIKNIKQYRIINNQIVFFGSENSINYQGGALIVIDGRQMGTDISTVQNISPVEVERINISTNPMDIQRYTGLNSVGVIEIYLKSAKIAEPEPYAAERNKYDGAFRIPNIFQSPVSKNSTNTTLIWIPDHIVDQNGVFEFTISSGKVISDFVIEVQGITPEGRLGSGKATFSVVK